MKWYAKKTTRDAHNPTPDDQHRSNPTHPEACRNYLRITKCRSTLVGRYAKSFIVPCHLATFQSLAFKMIQSQCGCAVTDYHQSGKVPWERWSARAYTLKPSSCFPWHDMIIPRSEEKKKEIYTHFTLIPPPGKPLPALVTLTAELPTGRISLANDWSINATLAKGSSSSSIRSSKWWH